MRVILQAIGLTLAVVFSLVVVAATLYVSIWFIIGIAVVVLFTAILKLIRAKLHLTDNSYKL